MGKVIPKQDIEEIRARNDIVDVIGSYIQLKRAGGSHKALCPFHKEKTPSFNVNAQRQIFHCFGCGAGGDVFRFVMDYENVDFTTAARMLADRCGMTLNFSEEQQKDAQDKSLLYKLLSDIATAFHKNLLSGDMGDKARNYLEQRDISEQTIQDFLLGYAPEDGGAVFVWGRKKGYSEELLEAAGLVARSKDRPQGPGSHYSRFRHRLMIPIRDELGRVVGFSGRVLDSNQPGGKYVNSPETVVFHKSRILFALDLARRDIVESRRAVVCEGQLDAIRCHAAGLTNVVASQGTALTEDHARLLKRYADTAVLVMDADHAGEEAALRASEHFMAAGLATQIAELPDGEDPDSLIKNQGADIFQHLVENAPSALDFMINVQTRRENLDQEAGLARASQAVLEMITRLPSHIQRERAVRRTAQRLGVGAAALATDLRRRERRRGRARNPESDEETARKTKQHPSEEVALVELMAAHAVVKPIVKDYLPPEHISDRYCRFLMEELLDCEDAGSLLEKLPSDAEDLTRFAARILMTPDKLEFGEVDPESAARDLILVIRRKSLERQRNKLQRMIPTAKKAEQERLRIESQQIAVDMVRLRQGWESARPILEL